MSGMIQQNRNAMIELLEALSGPPRFCDGWGEGPFDAWEVAEFVKDHDLVADEYHLSDKSVPNEVIITYRMFVELTEDQNAPVV